MPLKFCLHWDWFLYSLTSTVLYANNMNPSRYSILIVDGIREFQRIGAFYKWKLSRPVLPECAMFLNWRWCVRMSDRNITHLMNVRLFCFFCYLNTIFSQPMAHRCPLPRRPPRLHRLEDGLNPSLASDTVSSSSFITWPLNIHKTHVEIKHVVVLCTELQIDPIMDVFRGI